MFGSGSLTCWGARLQPGTGALLVTDVPPVDVLRVGEAQLRVPPDVDAPQQDLCGRHDISARVDDDSNKTVIESQKRRQWQLPLPVRLRRRSVLRPRPPRLLSVTARA